jgi:hypothetical protein
MCQLDRSILGGKLLENTFGWKTRRPGVDAMITIFFDFRQFSPKKMAFFLTNQCYGQIFA